VKGVAVRGVELAEEEEEVGGAGRALAKASAKGVWEEER